MSDSPQVHVLPLLTDNYAYLLTWESQAVVVDPGEAAPVRAFLQERHLNLHAILCTHHHADHVDGNLALKREYGCTVIGSDASRIPGQDQLVGEGDLLELGPLTLRVLETPGHGAKDISFVLSGEGGEPDRLFCGDTLFCSGCGRLFECPPARMWASLQKLAALPDETEVYCGHEYTVDNLQFALAIEPGNAALQRRMEEVQRLRKRHQPTVPSTLALEKKTNLFLRAPSAEAFADLRKRKDRF